MYDAQPIPAANPARSGDAFVSGRARIAPGSFDSLDRTMEQCLLDTQRQVQRLEAILHRLSLVAARAGTGAAGAIALLDEGNRRLQREVDEFALDSHALARLDHSHRGRRDEQRTGIPA